MASTLMSLSANQHTPATTRPEETLDSTSKKDPSKKKKDELRKVMRNRAAAQQSRIRKKIYVDDLESKTVALSITNSNLAQNIQTLLTENKFLKEQLDYLQVLLVQAKLSTQAIIPRLHTEIDISPHTTGLKLPGPNYLLLGVTDCSHDQLRSITHQPIPNHNSFVFGHR